MMKKNIMLMLLTVLTMLISQAQDKGIRFENTLTFDQVKARAKAENKYIFVDCYATWCMPCKAMDATVYPDPAVGDYFNNRFISLKIQMDKTATDDEKTKKWYGAASALTTAYSIYSYPTYLYFSPDGQIVHKHIGAGTVSDFISWAKEAQDPTKQYYAVLRNFKTGILDTADEKALAQTNRFTDPQLAGKLLIDYLGRGGWKARVKMQSPDLIAMFGSNPLVRQWIETKLPLVKSPDLGRPFWTGLLIAFRGDSLVANRTLKLIGELPKSKLADSTLFPLLAAYSQKTPLQERVSSYLNSLSDHELLRKNQIELAVFFSKNINVNDRLFNLFYRQGAEIDHLMNRPGFASSLIDAIVSRVFVDPAVRAINDDKQGEPDWNAVYNDMAGATDTLTATRNINFARYAFYYNHTKLAESKKSEDCFRWGSKCGSMVPKIWSPEQVATSHADYFSLLGVNNACWMGFEYCNDNNTLQKLASLSEKVTELLPDNGNYLDTYANLVYKLGKKEQAIALEKRAASLDPKNKDIAEGLNKMQKGLPTWPLPSDKK